MPADRQSKGGVTLLRSVNTEQSPDFAPDARPATHKERETSPVVRIGETPAEARIESRRTQEVPAAQEAGTAPARRRPSKRKLMLLAGALEAVLAGAGYGYLWWTGGRFMVSTVDAYVR